MCGIVGAISFGRREHGIERFVRWATGQMRRRGPDAEGYAEIGQAIFGFRRLAIRDLSEAANQPMLDPSGRFMLVFNGEIYNTEKLKNRLRFAVKFRTHSDTEVLLHCLLQLGIELTLPMLDGMFALAWYDAESGTLTLARDRSGIKPLYYAVSKNHLLFCSDYDLLLCQEDFQNLRINPDALANYLRLGFVPDGEALYKDTFLLPHGHSLIVDRNGSLKLSAYYNYPVKRLATEYSIPNLQEVLSASVQSQLVSDVPLGVFQSGGIDSSLVSAAASGMRQDLEAYTIGLASGGFMDESNEAYTVARAFGLRHHLRKIDESDVLFNLISQNSEAFSEPFADYSSLPALLLAQFAKERITVALSGDGGDELFWGYPRNRYTVNYASIFLKKKWPRRALICWNKISPLSESIPLELLRYPDFTTYVYNKIFITGAKKWAGRIFKHQPEPPFFLKKIVDDLTELSLSNVRDLMNVQRKIEFDLHMQRVLLKVDRTSMYHSLEVRVPLLSNDMLDASTNYRYDMCIGKYHGKIPLRDLFASMHGDASLSLLPKKGFTVPIDDWINGLLLERVRERVLELPSQWHNYFDKKQLELLWQSSSNEKNGWLIWAVFTLFEWNERRLNKLRQDYQNSIL
ncbi:MAG: asparagine synthase (glutamine-hydrolyzing) [Thermaurantimonas sp.]|uniref:asparagine synthase (glutamine-hydrolyzing) n=1 Tax=Thermaurantimonas sp. TaxID=2681568 RepID=UPI00391B2949